MAKYYNLTLDEAIDFAPADEVTEVMQNVRTIVNTAIKSVPLDRELGINADIVDDPINLIRGKLQARIMDAISKFEPRAQVIEINFSGDGKNGKTIPRIKVAIK